MVHRVTKSWTQLSNFNSLVPMIAFNETPVVLKYWLAILHYASILILKYVYHHESFTNFLLFLFNGSVLSNFLKPYRLKHSQASLSFTISQNLFKLISIDSMMPFNHFTLDHFFSCPQSFLASESFPMSQLCNQVIKILDLQPQHESFPRIIRVNFF